MPRFTFFLILLFGCASCGLFADSFREVSFETADVGTVYANLYGEGDHAVVLAHGAIFDKESWHPLATAIVKKGLQVLAIDFRGYGKSQSGSRASAKYLDLLAGMDFLSTQGAKRVSMLGASMGGGAAAQAAVEAKTEQLVKLILLAPARVSSPNKLQGNKLFIVSKGDGLYSSVVSAHKKASGPKRLEVLEGDAHAQHIFKTRHGVALTEMIVDFLAE